MSDDIMTMLTPVPKIPRMAILDNCEILILIGICRTKSKKNANPAPAKETIWMMFFDLSRNLSWVNFGYFFASQFFLERTWLLL